MHNCQFFPYGSAKMRKQFQENSYVKVDCPNRCIQIFKYIFTFRLKSSWCWYAWQIQYSMHSTWNNTIFVNLYRFLLLFWGVCSICRMCMFEMLFSRDFARSQKGQCSFVLYHQKKEFSRDIWIWIFPFLHNKIFYFACDLLPQSTLKNHTFLLLLRFGKGCKL